MTVQAVISLLEALRYWGTNIQEIKILLEMIGLVELVHARRTSNQVAHTFSVVASSLPTLFSECLGFFLFGWISL